MTHFQFRALLFWAYTATFFTINPTNSVAIKVFITVLLPMVALYQITKEDNQ